MSVLIRTLSLASTRDDANLGSGIRLARVVMAENREAVPERVAWIELAYERLHRTMTDGFDRLERKLDRVIQAESTATRPRRSTRSKKRT